ncbi:MAG: hypothetical protein COC17_00485 [Hyphomicrobiales bacterium]|nr:PH domain-containing protein [Hyphomicrobiales bacterium]PCH51604.1 MAG: hypothetical protein COC17_00485 [Hyphomicrobiales bacterium]
MNTRYTKDNMAGEQANISTNTTTNTNGELADVPRVLEVEDSTELEVADKMGRPTYHAHWQIFLPTIVIFISYTSGLYALYMMDMSSSALFRLGAIVLGVGVPLLTAHAFLRYSTVRLQLMDRQLRYHKGWPEDASVEVPYELISSLRVKKGIAGRLFGGGTIIIQLTTGTKIAIADIFDPSSAKEEYLSLRL